MTSQMHENTGKAPQSFETQAGSLIASAALLAAGAWSRSAAVLDVRGARRITLLIDYIANAVGGVGGFPEIVPLVSFEGQPPGAADPVWFGMGVWNGTVTEGTLSGTLPAGTDFTPAPNFAVTKHEPLIVSLDPADNVSDRVQMAVTIDVTSARWFQILAHEKGAPAASGTLAVTYALGA
jgi:hypothetical protein